MKQYSITLRQKPKPINKKFLESTLDAYSLKKYRTLYQDNKTKVNNDIVKLSIKCDTVVPKDITMLLFAQMLPPKDKIIYLEKHKKEITKFS
jgi:hypothetical protein